METDFHRPISVIASGAPLSTLIKSPKRCANPLVLGKSNYFRPNKQLFRLQEASEQRRDVPLSVRLSVRSKTEFLTVFTAYMTAYDSF